MVRLLAAALLIPTLVFSIYPFINHPPIFLYQNDSVYLSTSFSSPTWLKITLYKQGEVITLIDGTSSRHKVLIPFEGRLEYTITTESASWSGFLTVPSSDLKEFSILVYGDTRNDHAGIQKKIVRFGKNTDFLIHLGDIAFTGMSDDEWIYFFDAMNEFGKVIFTVRGNHEIPGLRYSMYLYPNQYTFRIGDFRFIVLDSFDLVNTLKVKLRDFVQKYGSEKTSKILLIHVPVFTCGKYRNDPQRLLFEDLHPLIRDLGIKLVLSSHDHNYQRIERDGVTYLVFGGGGAPLYRVEKNCKGLIKSFEGHSFSIFHFSKKDLEVDVYDIEGGVIDHFWIHF